MASFPVRPANAADLYSAGKAAEERYQAAAGDYSRHTLAVGELLEVGNQQDITKVMGGAVILPSTDEGTIAYLVPDDLVTEINYHYDRPARTLFEDFDRDVSHLPDDEQEVEVCRLHPPRTGLQGPAVWSVRNARDASSLAPPSTH